MTGPDLGVAPQFAPESLAVARSSAGAPTARGAPPKIVSSADAGWTSLLLVACEAGDGDQTPFETAATPDQLLVLSLNGPSDLECFSAGRWRSSVRQAGSCGLTPGGATDRLRRRARDPHTIRTAHLFLPQAFFADAREQFRRAGTRCHDAQLNALAFRDPVVADVVLGLLGAVEAGVPDLYAQAAGQFLATHLLSRHSPWPDGTPDRRHPGLLTDRRLARVLEYMSAHHREPLALDRLAAEAGISKFHFVRLFKAATGETPHGYLVRLRMDAACQMLRDTDLTVAEVAAASSYASAAQFRAAFVRHAGCAPTAFRARARAGSRLGAVTARGVGAGR